MNRIEDLLPPDLVDALIGSKIQVPSFCFNPADPWAWVFQRGLLRMHWHGCVHEVGVGAGLNVLQLITRYPNLEISFSDYHPEAANVAYNNVCGNIPSECRKRVRAVTGAIDLLGLNQPNGIVVNDLDAVIACIPQVLANGKSLRQNDNLAHYYERDRYKSELHCLGLGLNDALLEQAKNALKPGGQVVLNLGGRPGLRRLINMFEAKDFTEVNVIYEEMIPQDRTTSLQSLAAIEGIGNESFEFYADHAGSKPINATIAEVKRVAAESVYHRVYVIAGTWLG